MANVHELRAHDGPAWQRWRRAMAASVGATLPEDLPDAEARATLP
jgi:hypothetical protein